MVATELRVPGLELASNAFGHLILRDPATGTVYMDFGTLALANPDGTLAAPGISFQADKASGLYRIGANDLGVSVGGVQVQEVTQTAVKFPADTGGLEFASFPLAASSASQAFFVATRPMKIVGVTVRPSFAGTDAGAVTLQINKCPDGTAPAAGTAVHAGTANLKAAANTKQSLALSGAPANLLLASGDALCAVFAGTLTAVVGIVTVAMVPV